MKLHLGVMTDIPYADAPGKTIADVAEILEDKYHIMELFFEIHADDIARAMESSLAGAFENQLAGGTAAPSFDAAASEIESMFRRFLSEREIEGLGDPGVPTEAALAGINHSLRHPYAKANARRPSFVDTDLYKTSFAAWIDDG